MAIITLDTQSAPATPSGAGTLYFDSTSKLLTMKNDSGIPRTVQGVRNASAAAQAFLAADVYVTGSSLAIPSHLLQVGATIRWRIVATKTAGTGSPVWTVRFGTAGAVGDTARVTFTQVAAGTSVADAGFFDIECVVRVAGASGVLAGGLRMDHVLATTGWSTLGSNVQQVTSSAFDMTVANSIIGLSFNHQTAGAGSIEVVSAELVNS